MRSATSVGFIGLGNMGRPMAERLDCSTVSAEVTDEVATAARARGGDLLAAPVAGGLPVIPEGRLAIVCSGAPAAFQYAQPVLNTLAHAVIYAGPGAVSSHVKILHNLVAAVLVHVLAEVSVLAESIGVTRADLLEFLCAGAVGSPFIRYKAELMKSLDFTAAFTSSLILMLKDVNFGHDLAVDGGIEIPLIEHTRNTIADLVAAGLGDFDIAKLIDFLAARNGIQLQTP